MKRKFIFMAAHVIALFFALTLIGCPQPTGGGGSGGSGGSGGGSGSKKLPYAMYAYNGSGVLIGYLDELEYDSKGNPKKCKIYDANSVFSGYRIYEYNSNGKVVKITNDNIIGFSGLSDSFYEYKYEYDSRGYVTKQSSYDASGVLINYIEYSDYDSNGNYKKSELYNASGVLGSYSEYEYDSKGNPTKSSDYIPSTGALSGYNTYEYDSNGNITKHSYYTLMEGPGALLMYYEILVYK
jgi:hypothetical protein